MSLKRIIKEFQDKDIPLGIAKAVSKFDSVGSIELAEDYPLNVSSSEAYVYLVKTKSGDERILRISRQVSDQRFFYDLFSEFRDNKYENIVKVYFSGVVKDYDVTVMEKLERTLNKENEIEAIFDLSYFLMSLDYRAVEEVMSDGIIEYVYSDKEPKTKFKYSDKDIEDFKGGIIANIARGGVSEKVTRDIAQAIEDYYKVVGDVYDDLHADNVMISKDGTYKLIDL